MVIESRVFGLVSGLAEAGVDFSEGVVGSILWTELAPPFTTVVSLVRLTAPREARLGCPRSLGEMSKPEIRNGFKAKPTDVSFATDAEAEHALEGDAEDAEADKQEEKVVPGTPEQENIERISNLWAILPDLHGEMGL